MKNRLIILLAFLFLCHGALAQQSKAFHLKGKIADVSDVLDSWIYLSYEQNGEQSLDSTQIVDGKYTFSGKFMYPTKATLRYKVSDSVEKKQAYVSPIPDYICEFYIDAGTMTAYAPQKMNSTIIKGSAADDDKQRLDALLKPFFTQRDAYYQEEAFIQAIKEKDSKVLEDYQRKNGEVWRQIDSTKKDFLFRHPESGIALDLLQYYTSTMLEYTEIAPLFNQLQPALRKSPKGEEFAERLEQARKTAIGKTAPDFKLKDKNGKDISLYTSKGKVILLDFWGSWCGPCRQTHPHLRDLYTMYKEKGFEIIGVAVERGNEEENYRNWTKALDEDQMDWINLLGPPKDATGNTVVKMYSVRAYPTKVLIGRDGNIIRRFIGSGLDTAKELDELLAELLGT